MEEKPKSAQPSTTYGGPQEIKPTTTKFDTMNEDELNEQLIKRELHHRGGYISPGSGKIDRSTAIAMIQDHDDRRAREEAQSTREAIKDNTAETVRGVKSLADSANTKANWALGITVIGIIVNVLLWMFKS